MGSERVDADCQNIDDILGAEDGKSAPLSYSEYFEKMCPEYMAMGMTYDEYWNGNASLVRVYRETQKIKNKQRNYEMWLQGMYYYEALLDASPMFRFSTKPTKPLPYPSQPYALTKEEIKAKEEMEEKKQMLAMKAYMEGKKVK